jgi:hypothetical protein
VEFVPFVFWLVSLILGGLELDVGVFGLFANSSLWPGAAIIIVVITSKDALLFDIV